MNSSPVSSAGVKSLSPARSRRRAFATVVVFALIVFATILLTTVQASSLSQASSGREALARVRAQWAARAGIESAIARIEAIVDRGETTDAFLTLEDTAAVADGELDGASWAVRAQEGAKEVAGAQDAGARININRATRDQLLAVQPLMGEDQVDAVLDWIDDDDDTRELGAEVGYYKSQAGGVEPRNGPMRSITELELVAGIDQTDVRGEDWNLNGVLDPNEDDGEVSWPPDNRDGQLDRGWSGVFTTQSVENPKGKSGEPRLDLTAASESQIAERVGCTAAQAREVFRWVEAQGEQIQIADFVVQPLPALARAAAQRRGATRQEIAAASRTPDLSREQLANLVDEFSIGPADAQVLLPGRLNINTCEAKLLETLPGLDPAIADAIVAERAAQTNGFASVVDLLDIPEVTREILGQILAFIDVRSTVYVVASKGVDANTGMEVEIVATIDASTLPASIKELHVR
jgi:DNA uptake protein ComE-like DNA-binding protein